MPLKKVLENIFLDKELIEKVKFLGKLDVFNGLDYRALARVYQIMEVKNYNAGEVIFSEGDIGRAIFIIKKGEVALSKSGKPLATVKDGEFFGEMALLEGVPRTATAKTVCASEIGFIYKVRFDSLMEAYPALGLKIVHNLARLLSYRLRQTSAQYVKSI